MRGKKAKALRRQARRLAKPVEHIYETKWMGPPDKQWPNRICTPGSYRDIYQRSKRAA